MSRDFDVIVAGAGISGAAFAAALAARRVVEPARIALVAGNFATAPDTGLDIDLRVYAMSRASQRLLTELGIWQRLPPDRCAPYERMCVWDSKDSADAAAALRFDCADLGEPDLGAIVEGRTLQWLALEAARTAGVVLIEARIAVEVAGGLPTDAASPAAVLNLTDGRQLKASLVVAVDGAQSTLRTLNGIPVAGHSYHQQAIVAHVRTALPHCRTAWQRFLPTGPLALLPLADGRSSIVWSADRKRASELLALPAPEFASAVTEATDQVLGACELASDRAAFPLNLQYATAYVRPRFALLGDAAHSVHPLAGQGLNLGLRDVEALVRLMSTVPATDFGDLRFLRRYERERKTDNLIAATTFDGLNRLFSNDDPALGRLRSFGLSAVGRAPLLKRFFAKRALGI